MGLLSFQHINQSELLFHSVEEIDNLFFIFFVVLEFDDAFVGWGFDFAEFEFSHGLSELVELYLFFCEGLEDFAFIIVHEVEILSGNKDTV